MTTEKKLHQSVATAVATVFGYRKYRVSISSAQPQPVVTVCYADFLTPATLLRRLSAVASLPVHWNLERTLSTSLRVQLLNELFLHPELLSASPVFRGNVRRFILDRFATADFENLNVS